MRKAIVVTVVLDSDGLDNDGCPEPTDQDIVDGLLEDFEDADGEEVMIETPGSEYRVTMTIQYVSVDGVTLYDATPYVPSNVNETLPWHSRIERANDPVDAPRHAASA